VFDAPATPAGLATPDELDADAEGDGDADAEAVGDAVAEAVGDACGDAEGDVVVTARKTSTAIPAAPAAASVVRITIGLRMALGITRRTLRALPASCFGLIFR
jgi:hypothetical protein